MKIYKGLVLRSHKGRGPDRVQVIGMHGDQVCLRYLNSRSRQDFRLGVWFLEHPSCGWVPDRGKGGLPPAGGDVSGTGGQ